MNHEINRLLNFALQQGLLDQADRVYGANLLLAALQLEEFSPEEIDERLEVPDEILGRMLDYAAEQGIIEDTANQRDLFDTLLMNCVMPRPSEVIRAFRADYDRSPELATDNYYKLSIASNYIRKARIDKNVIWQTATEYGDLDITINLSKPEKDPRDIAKAKLVKSSSYPKCLLCRENEGFAGHASHPARQTHRLIPLDFGGREWFLQYSPYTYYNEHCIIFNKQHTPMKIDGAVFKKILEFVKQFPHYTAGSNADLPIVGGSILSHDHFQGGGYVFAMAKALYDRNVTISGYEDLTAGVVKWPMSVIRLQGKDIDRISKAADHILNSWRSYSDEAAFIFCETEGIPHNTITPIARMHGDLYELDLVLRNNITTDKCPWGVYHPSADLHHIKKENIGLIEVMGLAVLPARLKKEMSMLEDYILNNKDIRENDDIEKHAEWVDTWIDNYDIKKDNIHKILQDEISKVFIKVLECAGVYKRTKDGQDAFDRFVNIL